MGARTKAIVKAILINGFVVCVSFPIVFLLAWLARSTLVDPGTGAFSLDAWSFLYKAVEGSQGVPLVWPILGFTVVFALTVAAVDVLVAVPAAYAASRLDFRGKLFLIRFLFLLQAFPGVLVLIAVFFLMVSLRLVNTLGGIVLLSAVSMLPSHVYMLKGFFDSVPWDLEQASMVDGCTRRQALCAVLLPAVKPGILVIAVFAFMAAYGEWFLFSVFLYDDSYYTMARTISIMVLASTETLPAGATTAFGLFYTVPVALFYAFSQRLLLSIRNLGGRKFV